MTGQPGPEPLLEPGFIVDFGGQRHVVLQLLGDGAVLLRNLTFGQVLPVLASELGLQPTFAHLKTRPVDLLSVETDSWKVALTRHQAIEPLLGLKGRQRTQAMVEERAKLAGVHVATVYRWLDAYESSGKLDTLLPRTRKDKDIYRLEPGLEVIVQAVIGGPKQERRKRGLHSVVAEIRMRCEAAGLPVPHDNTVRRRFRDRGVSLGRAEKSGQEAEVV